MARGAVGGGIRLTITCSAIIDTTTPDNCHAPLKCLRKAGACRSSTAPTGNLHRCDTISRYGLALQTGGKTQPMLQPVAKHKLLSKIKLQRRPAMLCSGFTIIRAPLPRPPQKHSPTAGLAPDEVTPEPNPAAAVDAASGIKGVSHISHRFASGELRKVHASQVPATGGWVEPLSN